MSVDEKRESVEECEAEEVSGEESEGGFLDSPKWLEKDIEDGFLDPPSGERKMVKMVYWIPPSGEKEND